MNERASLPPVLKVYRVELELPEEGLATTVLVAPVGEAEFQIYSFPFLSQTVGVRDVVDAVFVEDNESREVDRLRLRCVTSRAKWHVRQFMCPPEVVASPDFSSGIDRLQEAGGFWESLGDLHAIYWPPETQFSPSASLISLIGDANDV